LRFIRSASNPGPCGLNLLAALGRVTRQAVPLGVAGDAGLDVLPCGSAVIEEEDTAGVMVSLLQIAGRHQARLLMAGDTECGLIVALSALGLPIEGGGRDAGSEIQLGW
jgi:hypothetical protein